MKLFPAPSPLYCRLLRLPEPEIKHQLPLLEEGSMRFWEADIFPTPYSGRRHIGSEPLKMPSEAPRKKVQGWGVCLPGQGIRVAEEGGGFFK